MRNIKTISNMHTYYSNKLRLMNFKDWLNVLTLTVYLGLIIVILVL